MSIVRGGNWAVALCVPYRAGARLPAGHAVISLPVRIPRRTAPSPERRRLASAQWSITLRISLVMSVIMLLVVAIVYSVVLFAPTRRRQRETQWGIRHNTVDSPPICMWITVERDEEWSAAPARGTPDGLPVKSSLAAVRAGAPPVLERVERGGEECTGAHRVARRRGGTGGVRERSQRADREHLLLAFATAESIGLLLVAAASRMLARRAVAPLSDALDRQRRFVGGRQT